MRQSGGEQVMRSVVGNEEPDLPVRGRCEKSADARFVHVRLIRLSHGVAPRHESGAIDISACNPHDPRRIVTTAHLQLLLHNVSVLHVKHSSAAEARGSTGDDGSRSRPFRDLRPC